MSGKKLIVSDFDDTLVVIYEPFLVFIEWRCRELGIEAPSRELIKKHWGKHYGDFHPLVFPNVSDECLWSCEERPNYARMNGYNNLIDYVRDNENKLGILTSRKRDSVESTVKRVGINLDDFNFVYTFEDSQQHKPHKDSFNSVLRFANDNAIKREDIIYIGDTLIDYQTTINAGIGFVAVTSGVYKFEDFIKMGLERERIVPNIGYVPKSGCI